MFGHEWIFVGRDLSDYLKTYLRDMTIEKLSMRPCAQGALATLRAGRETARKVIAENFRRAYFDSGLGEGEDKCEKLG
jgi:hypothetical protein